MPIPAHEWLKGQTLSNGFCGYHSMAEAFVRVARNRPELINDQFFNPDNPLFRPTYDFLRGRLNITEELTPGFLQTALLRDEIRLNGALIAQHIAPAMFILALTHYRTAIAPARAEFIRQETGLGFNAALNLAAELAMASLQQHDPFGGIGANRDIERAHYVEYLSIAIYNWEEEHALFHDNRKIPLVAHFLNSQDQTLSAATAADFSNLVYHQGLNYSQFPTISIFDNLCRLMFRPIAIEADHGVAAPIPYYPVTVVFEDFLSLPHHPAPHEVIAAVYRCRAGAHFQYALPPLCVQEFRENVSQLSAVARIISGLTSHRQPSSTRKNNKAHRAILQKQALAKVRAEKHAQFMQQAAALHPHAEINKGDDRTALQKQIQDIEFQIRYAEMNTQKGASRKDSNRRSRQQGVAAYTPEINKLRATLAELKQQEINQTKAKETQAVDQCAPLTFSTQRAPLSLDLSSEKESLENQINQLRSGDSHQNEAQIEILQLQREQLRLIEKETLEQQSMEQEDRRTGSQRYTPRPLLSNTVYPQEAGPIGRVINYVIEQLIEFLMRTLSDFSEAVSARGHRFGR